MKETQLDRFEKKFDSFVEYVQGRFQRIETEIDELKSAVGGIRAELAETDIEGLKSAVGGIRAELAAFRVEVREQFENVADRLRLLENRLGALSTELPKLRRAVNDVRAEVELLRLKAEAIETATLETSLRVIQLRDDMQQRFRVVHERLSAFEKKFAA